MTKLKWLDLKGANVTDAGLECLKCLTKLKALGLEGTNFTDKGVKKFQQALPNCEILR